MTTLYWTFKSHAPLSSFYVTFHANADFGQAVVWSQSTMYNQFGKRMADYWLREEPPGTELCVIRIDEEGVVSAAGPDSILAEVYERVLTESVGEEELEESLRRALREDNYRIVEKDDGWSIWAYRPLEDRQSEHSLRASGLEDRESCLRIAVWWALGLKS